jgi:hypothetical protein
MLANRCQGRAASGPGNFLFDLTFSALTHSHQDGCFSRAGTPLRFILQKTNKGHSFGHKYRD